MSDTHAGEEMHDTVHDLHGEIPMSATMMQGESADQGIDYERAKKRSLSGHNVR